MANDTRSPTRAQQKYAARVCLTVVNVPLLIGLYHVESAPITHFTLVSALTVVSVAAPMQVSALESAHSCRTTTVTARYGSLLIIFFVNTYACLCDGYTLWMNGQAATSVQSSAQPLWRRPRLRGVREMRGKAEVELFNGAKECMPQRCKTKLS